MGSNNMEQPVKIVPGKHGRQFKKGPQHPMDKGDDQGGDVSGQKEASGPKKASPTQKDKIRMVMMALALRQHQQAGPPSGGLPPGPGGMAPPQQGPVGPPAPMGGLPPRRGY